MKPTILAGSANTPLAESVAATLDIRPSSRKVRVFPDGELHVELHESVRGEDVYLIQPTSPPAEIVIVTSPTSTV